MENISRYLIHFCLHVFVLLDTVSSSPCAQMIVLTTLSIIATLLTWNDVGGSKWWNGWSPNDNNDRYQREPTPVILATTKIEFKQLWFTKLNGSVMTPPTVYEHHVYVATMNGMFYCLQADNGAILWHRNLSDIINNGHAYYSRTSPLVYNDIIHMGLSDLDVLTQVPGSVCYLIAFDRFTGILATKSFLPYSVYNNRHSSTSE